MMKNQATFVVFADDWGRHPSSCQHLFKHLLRNCTVVWVNTIGMRQPELDLITFRRGLEKITQWLAPGRWRWRVLQQNGRQPIVINPVMWPRIKARWERWINRQLLMRQLSRVFNRYSPPRVAVTTIPIVAELVGTLPVERWIYYCVDDFSNWPEMDSEALTTMEKVLIERVDVLVAAGEVLKNRLGQFGREVFLLEHGIDWELWQGHSETQPIEADYPAFAKYEKPWIVFWGSVNWQIDPAIVTRIAAEIEHGTVLFVGPVTDCDRALKKLSRVRLAGPLPYHDLPRLAREASVLIMPYQTGPGVYESAPLKLLEYLATDKPVVVCDIPATRRWADALDIARTPEEFAASVVKRLRAGPPREQLAARQRVSREDWRFKAAEFAKWAFAGLPPAPTASPGSSRPYVYRLD